jgi:FixJ family two-component response regulator
VLDRQDMLNRLSSLSERELDVFGRVAAGDMSKVIGFDLGISERTVEVHRSNIMKKLGVRTLADLVRIKFEAKQLSASE